MQLELSEEEKEFFKNLPLKKFLKVKNLQDALQDINERTGRKYRLDNLREPKSIRCLACKNHNFKIPIEQMEGGLQINL
jgi:hypothetical protein